MLLFILLSCIITIQATHHLSFPMHRRAVSGSHASRQWRHSLTSPPPSSTSTSTDNHHHQQRRLYKEIASVHKESDGVYFTTICIGDVGSQCFTVIVDTGSSTIAVPCKGCDCGSQHSYYDQAASKSVVDSGSSYSQCYGEGSCNRGKLLQDTICFGKGCLAESGIKHPFGCCTQYSPNFRSQDADGIIGVSPSGRTLWKDLATHHKLDTNQLAICFGTTGGEMTVGGWDETIPGPAGNMSASQEMRWTDMKTSDSFYRVVMSSMVVGDASTTNSDSASPAAIQVSGFTATRPMVDCGSTFSFMRKSNWNRLRSALMDYCKVDPIHRCKSLAGRNPGGDESGDADMSLGCYKFSTNNKERWEQMSTFPSLTFQMQESDSPAAAADGSPVNMCVPATQYFFLSGAKANVYCGGIFSDAQDVIGANLLANFLVVFQEQPQRMGLARAQCDRNMDPGGGGSGGSGGSSGSLSPSSFSLGPCGSPNGRPFPASGSSIDAASLFWAAAISVVVTCVVALVLYRVGCYSRCWCCRGQKYTQLESGEVDSTSDGVAKGVALEEEEEEEDDDDEESRGRSNEKHQDGEEFGVELTDQEMQRTEELVRAADAIFASVENGVNGEEVEYDGEDAI